MFSLNLFNDVQYCSVNGPQHAHKRSRFEREGKTRSQAQPF